MSRSLSQLFMLLAATACTLIATGARGADIPGASDPVGLPRVAGAEILGYQSTAYDASPFLREGADNRPEEVLVEGAWHRVVYLTKEGDTPLMVQKNYEVALGELGAVEETYSCRNNCRKHTLSTTLWTKDNMVDLPTLPHTFYFLGFAHVFDKPTYRYATVNSGTSTFHVGVLSATLAESNANGAVRGRTVVVLDVLETKAFEETLEFVDAAEMTKQLSSLGAVALYGIEFDHDKATLRDASEPTIQEIAALLASESELSLYVVGHTDDVGTLAYNQDLSLRRANSVVERLATLGVARSRLTPVGVGPVAPTASNDAEDGRALNRRVELVKRQR